LKPANPDFFQMIKVKIKVDPKETNKQIFIEYRDKMGSLRNTSTEWMDIPVSDFNEKYMLELTVSVNDSTRSIPASDKCSFDIIAKLERNTFSSMKEQKLSLNLYRHDKNMKGTNDDPFKYYRKNNNKKDHDFFVLPRKNQTEHQSTLIKRMQLLHNQVIARHKGLSKNDFSFANEDGLFSSEQAHVLGKSISVFNKTQSTAYANIKSTCPCNISKYGPSRDLISYLSQNYGMQAEELLEIILDRNFLYGEDNECKNLEEIYGLESLYQNIVIPFNEGIIKEAERYVNFNQPWLSRPRTNLHYQRGTYTVQKKDKLKIYADDKEERFASTIPGLSKDNYLPTGTKIKFYPGADEHDREEEAYRYSIASLLIPAHPIKTFLKDTAFVPLTRKQKMMCNDKDYKENYGNYIDTNGASDPRDIAALVAYGKSFGVPYYMSEFNNTGGKDTYFTFESRLEKIPDNWYSYADTQKTKPSAPSNPDGGDVPGIGLDCSGLIMNCLLDTTVSEKTFFEELHNKRSIGEKAQHIGIERTRKIDIHIASDPAHSIIQAGDMIYSLYHIAMCAIDQKDYVSKEEIASRYFSIIHNYGESQIFITNKNTNFEGGHFHRTLKGPFKHCGISATNNQISETNSNIGRIYLWY
jgi:hypothetical protein